MDFALVLLLGLVAGTVGGVVGFGTSIMLMPALVVVFPAIVQLVSVTVPLAAMPPPSDPLDPTRYGDWEQNGIAVDF